MYLKRLEISGFKSFAKPTKLIFEPGITAVVGPNGSGKSNIADAVRWVLGEQSKSVIRSKKSEDVIFVGSASKARAASASVSVIFDNRDGKLPIDAAEVEFTRRVYRDGASEYLINNTTARLMDITDALAKAGFAQSRYTVIGQGIIDQFLLQGPGEIKAVIEEAAGISPLYDKRERAIRRLQATSENLEQVKSLIKEIEPRLRTLRRQAKRLQARTQIESEWQHLLSGRLHYVLGHLNKEKDELEQSVSKIIRQMDDLAGQIKKIASEREENDQATSEQTRELTTLQQQIMAETRKKEQIESQLSSIRAKSQKPGSDNLEILQKRWQSLTGDLTEVTNSWKQAQEDFEQSKQDVDEIINLLKNEKPELVSKFEQIVQKFIDTQKQFLARLQQQKEDIERQVKTLEAEISSQDTGKQAEDLHDLEKKTIEELNQQNKIIADLQKKLQAKLQGLSGYNAGRAQKDESLRKLETDHSKLQTVLSETRIKLTRVETKLEDEEAKARQELGVEFYEIVKKVDPIADTETDSTITHLKKQLDSIGALDDMTLQEYEETEDRYAYLSSQVRDLEKAAKDLAEVIEELNKVIKKNFHHAFEEISDKFGNYFCLLFNGGKADLNVIEQVADNNQDDRESEEEKIREGKKEITGIEVKATPPGKKLSSIAALSGGERTLTAIALLMALLDAYPSPFVMLDEADAALDESNSIRFAKILDQLADKTQFITITHNRETMRRAHTLYGVTMGDDGVSQLLSVKLDESLQFARD